MWMRLGCWGRLRKGLGGSGFDLSRPTDYPPIHPISSQSASLHPFVQPPSPTHLFHPETTATTTTASWASSPETEYHNSCTERGSRPRDFPSFSSHLQFPLQRPFQFHSFPKFQPAVDIMDRRGQHTTYTGRICIFLLFVSLATIHGIGTGTIPRHGKSGWLVESIHFSLATCLEARASPCLFLKLTHYGTGAMTLGLFFIMALFSLSCSGSATVHYTVL